MRASLSLPRGDFSGDFRGLNGQKKDVYESASRGYGAPGVEIGGFFSDEPTRKSLIRYAQLGALTPLMENGGKNGGQTVKSDVDAETFYFPSGNRWIDYWDEVTVYEGGTSTSYSVPLDLYPIFIRAGAIIPMSVRNDVTGHGDSSSAGKTTLLIYPHGSSSFTFHRPPGDGTDYADVVINVNESQGIITVEGDRPAGYCLRVKSFIRPDSVSGADSWSYDNGGQCIIINKQGQDFTVTIGGLKGYGTGE